MSSYLENLTNLKIVAAFPLISVSFHLLFVVSAERDESTRPPEMVTPGQEMASSYLTNEESVLSASTNQSKELPNVHPIDLDLDVVHESCNHSLPELSLKLFLLKVYCRINPKWQLNCSKVI